MDGFVIDRADGRADGEDWTEDYEELPGDASISIILESTTKAGVGPRLHQHPYAETFIIRRGWATFTIGVRGIARPCRAGPCGARQHPAQIRDRAGRL